MNVEWELNARKEGYEYFDEPFDGKIKSNVSINKPHIDF